jgi:hypothetical protein
VMKMWRLTILMLGASASCAAAGDQTFDDFFGEYFQRTDSVTIGAGDAKQVNAASQIVNPWPSNVRDRRIPGNGPRMTGAIQRYQDVKKLKEAAPPLAPEAISPTGFASGATVSR